MWYFYAEDKVAAMCRFTLAWAETKVAACILLIFGSIYQLRPKYIYLHYTRRYGITGYGVSRPGIQN